MSKEDNGMRDVNTKMRNLNKTKIYNVTNKCDVITLIEIFLPSNITLVLLNVTM